jgi:hypothetical protein
MKTLTEQYRLIKEDKGHKGVFLKEAKRQFPNLITNSATFNEASKILKQKNIISENFVGLKPINNPLERKKEGFENAFANFLAEEAKAEEKKPSKEVEEVDEHNYDVKDEKNPNNMIFGQIQMGYYCELKDPKNEGKTDHELLEIVYKNLAKDSIFYTKNGQFGEKDLGYTNEAPSLGEPEEPKGEHKSSGYGKLKEHSISTVGGLVTGTGFTSQNYMDFYDLNEGPKDEENMDDIEKGIDVIIKKKEVAGEIPLVQEEEAEEAIISIDGIVTQAEEMAREAEERGESINIDAIVDKALSEFRADVKNALEFSLNLDTSDR